MMTPQLTEQYGQVDRVSVVRAIFRARASARARVTSNPSKVALPAASRNKSRREAVTWTPWSTSSFRELSHARREASSPNWLHGGAGDGTRTRDVQLGNM